MSHHLRKRSEKQYFRVRGRSLINNKNKIGPKIEACGTPVQVVEKEDSPEPLSMAC